MKKISSIFLVIVFSISLFILPSKRNIKVKADVSQPYNKSYMSQYFYDLENNFPKNVYGTCGYVAISMLLQYYDNYLNADIIPEKYEVVETVCNGNDFVGLHKSPGVSRTTISREDMLPNEYFSYMISTKNEYIQGELFKIAQQKWYLPESNFTEDSGGLTRGGILNVLRGYLDSLGYSENSEEEGEDSSLEVGEYEITQCIEGWLWGNEEEDLKQFTKQKILQGYPVLLAVSREKTEADKVYDGTAGHAIIAYDYDIATDTIYCHSGWGYDQHNKVEDIGVGYQYWDFALVLDINLPHACDNNYLVDGVGYCFHNEEVITYNHVHNFAYCIDYEISGEQVLHTMKCASCFEEKEGVLGHDYEYSSLSKLLHSGVCLCGDTISEPHVIDTSNTISNRFGTWAPCLHCGYLMEINDNWGGNIIASLDVIKTSMNGSKLLKNGIILLVEEDIDAYLNGTLVFYNTQDNEMSIL